MRKRMMLFAAGTVIFVSAAQNTFAEEETGGIRKIADMVTEARRIKEGTEMFSVSMTLGDMEVSAGMTIRMTPDSASVDMLYLSAPNGDGTFFDFVSEDVLRVFGTKRRTALTRKRMRMCCRQQIQLQKTGLVW